MKKGTMVVAVETGDENLEGRVFIVGDKCPPDPECDYEQYYVLSSSGEQQVLCEYEMGAIH